MLEKEHIADSDFDNLYNLLQENKVALSQGDYFSLMMRYYMAKSGHLFNKAYRWLYYNTRFGPHPSPQARIEKIKKHQSKGEKEMAKAA